MIILTSFWQIFNKILAKLAKHIPILRTTCDAGVIPAEFLAHGQSSMLLGCVILQNY